MPYSPAVLLLTALGGFLVTALLFTIAENFAAMVDEANYMEREFGADVWAALKWKIGRK